MWSTAIDIVPRGERHRLLRNGANMSFQELLKGLASDATFASWYTTLLADSSFAACFWEHPPLTLPDLCRSAEFVLIDAPSLAGVTANPGPFREYFTSPTSEAATRFLSLGGDATLIAPGPGVGLQASAHLLAFVRQAPPDSVAEFWRLVARSTLELLSETPLWLSTSGLGVYWLHVRIDSVPKYYQHHPYRSTDRTQE